MLTCEDVRDLDSFVRISPRTRINAQRHRRVIE